MYEADVQSQIPKSNPPLCSCLLNNATMALRGMLILLHRCIFFHNRWSGATYLIWITRYKSGHFKGRGDGGNKTNESKCTCYCGDVTYICIEEECWSLSNVGNGQRTRQVTLAQKPQPLTVIFSLAEFSTARRSLRSGKRAALIDAEIRFDSCCVLQEESQSIWWEPGPESH